MARAPREANEKDSAFKYAVRAARAETGGDLKKVRRVVDAFTGNLAACLENGQRVSVPGLGVFSLRTRKARRVKNLAGEWIELPETREVCFRAAGLLKRSVNNPLPAGWRSKLARRSET